MELIDYSRDYATIMDTNAARTDGKGRLIGWKAQIIPCTVTATSDVRTGVRLPALLQELGLERVEVGQQFYLVTIGATRDGIPYGGGNGSSRFCLTMEDALTFVADTFMKRVNDAQRKADRVYAAAPRANRGKRTIRQTRHDNWYGYEGGRRVMAFGNTTELTAEQVARRWECGENPTDGAYHTSAAGGALA